MKEATQQRILFISYEFSGPLFSGNGVYSRTVVRALLQTLPNAEVLALCGSPPRSSVASAGVASASSSPLFDAPAALSSRLKVEQLQLRRWGSIDRSADYESFATPSTAIRTKVRAFNPQVVMFVDWTGGLLVQKLMQHGDVASSPRVVFLNFRVFSSNQFNNNKAATSDREVDRDWYAARERESVALADIVVALCPKDAEVLATLDSRARPIGKSGSSSSPVDFVVLNPPLRDDIRSIALQPHEVDPANSPSHASSTTRPLLRRWLLCCSRLSTEKNVELFLDTIRALGGRPTLERLGVVPLLLGDGVNSSAGAVYASSLRQQLEDVSGGLAQWQSFVGPSQVHLLAQIFRETRLNFHPARYEAFGMTVLEAAAFGTPTLLDGSGGVGVTSRLRPAHGEALAFFPSLDTGASSTPAKKAAVPMTAESSSLGYGAREAAQALLAALERDNDEVGGAARDWHLRKIGQRARERALAWDMTSFGQELAAAVLGYRPQ